MATKNSISYVRNQINSLFADNSNGEITAADLRNFCNILVDNIAMEGGGLRVTSQAASQTVGTTAVKLTGFDQEIQVGDSVIASSANDSFTAGYDGFYQYSANISATFPANTEVSITPAVNGVLSNTLTTLTGQGTSKPISFALPAGDIMLSSGDVVELYAIAESSGNLVIRTGFVQLKYVTLSNQA